MVGADNVHRAKALRVLLVGYGKMGREIEAAFAARCLGHSVVGRVDPHVVTPSAAAGGDIQHAKAQMDPHIVTPSAAADGVAVVSEVTDALLRDADVVVDFSVGESFIQNYPHYVRNKVPVVVGTTGWYHCFDQIMADFGKASCACVYGTNFSIGAQMFIKLVSRAAELLGPLHSYDFMLTEMHHKDKIDSPSGTAKTAAQKIIEAHPRKTKVVAEPLQRAIRMDELHVSSTRGGAVPGIHTLTVDSLSDTITISHSAHGRQGFALGAVLAAEWIVHKEGVYNVEHIIEQMVGEAS